MPVVSHTMSPSQPVIEPSPKLSHWAWVEQHDAGLCLVQPNRAAERTRTNPVAVRMASLSTQTRPGCAMPSWSQEASAICKWGHLAVLSERDPDTPDTA